MKTIESPLVVAATILAAAYLSKSPDHFFYSLRTLKGEIKDKLGNLELPQ